jgi:DUF917 family protein
MVRVVPASEIEALAIGAWILGTGGGGSPYHAYLNVRQLYAGGHQVRLMDPEALQDDALVAVVSTMGAPLVGQERLVDPQNAVRAVMMMQEYLGRDFDAVMSVEVGGSNALQPFLVAALTGLPVVDADAMGRAFPEAQMNSFAIGDLAMVPQTLCDVRGLETVVTKVPTWKWMERVARKVCTEYGSTAATCKAPRTGREVKDWGVLYTTTKAIAIGKAVLAARRAHTDPVAAVLELEGGKRIFTGKMADVQRRTTEGFLRGTAQMDGLEADRGNRMEIAFQNEFTVCTIGGVARAMTPDLICVLDTVSGEAIGTETLRYGQRATVIALPAAPVLLTPKGLQHVGPRAFGHDLDFTSVFAA